MPAFEHASDRASEDLPRSTPSTDSSTELTYSNISNPSAPPSKSVIYDLEDLFMVRSLPLSTDSALITCLKMVQLSAGFEYWRFSTATDKKNILTVLDTLDQIHVTINTEPRSLHLASYTCAGEGGIDLTGASQSADTALACCYQIRCRLVSYRRSCRRTRSRCKL